MRTDVTTWKSRGEWLEVVFPSTGRSPNRNSDRPISLGKDRSVRPDQQAHSRRYPSACVNGADLRTVTVEAACPGSG